MFHKVVPYAAHVPSFADTWGWQLCFTEAAYNNCTAAGGSPILPQDELDKRIADRIGADGLSYLDGAAIHGVSALNKMLRSSLANEKRVYTVDSPVFIHGQGIRTLV